MRRRLILAFWNFLYRRLRGREWLVIPLLILYWLSPVDLMPFLPLDDLLMTLVGSLFLLLRNRQRGGKEGKGSQGTSKDDVIDIEGRVIK